MTTAASAELAWLDEYIEYRDEGHKWGPERNRRLLKINRLFQRCLQLEAAEEERWRLRSVS